MYFKNLYITVEKFEVCEILIFFNLLCSRLDLFDCDNCDFVKYY